MPRKRKKEDKCGRCVYRSGTPDVNGCDFFLLTGERRGCPADESCARFREGRRTARRPADLGPAEKDLGEKAGELAALLYCEAEKRRRTRGCQEALRRSADSGE